MGWTGSLERWLQSDSPKMYCGGWNLGASSNESWVMVTSPPQVWAVEILARHLPADVHALAPTGGHGRAALQRLPQPTHPTHTFRTG